MSKTGLLAGLATLIGIGIASRMQDPVSPPVRHLDGRSQGRGALPAASALPSSQLKIEDILPGGGATALKGDRVFLRFRARAAGLPEPRVLPSMDSLYVTLGSGQYMRGLELGVQGMREGGRRRLVVPPHLTLPAVPAHPTLPPGSALVYEVDMISVTKGA